MGGTGPEVVVVGQIGRDLVLRVDELPEPGGSAPVRERRELLGGKGANQAVGVVQLGASAGLVGVVGDDDAGRDVLGQAARDGIDVEHVVRRPGVATALLVDVVADGGRRHLLEHVPDGVLLRAGDVRAAELLLRSARVVALQLQQPAEAMLPAAGIVGAAGGSLLLDGAPSDPAARDELLGAATVLRADAAEAALLVGHPLDTVRAVVAAAGELLSRGPRLVVLGAAEAGDVFVWSGGQQVIPRLTRSALDPTGGGDAMVAAIAVALLRDTPAPDSAWQSAAAAALTVRRLGGRPDLTADDLARPGATPAPGSSGPD